MTLRMYLNLVFLHSPLISNSSLCPRIRIYKQDNQKLSLVVRDTPEGVCFTFAVLSSVCFPIWKQVEFQASRHCKNNVILIANWKRLPGIKPQICWYFTKREAGLN